METATKKYRGFISYSQKDKAFARRLHTALEAYVTPRGVSSPLLNQKTRRLGRFFRDDDEMGAASDLGEALRGAIRDSDALIVLCSPNAAKSPWVNQEIVHFKLTGRADRIFGVIIDGQPNAALQAAECFPLALRFDIDPDGSISNRPDEPLAIDVRKESFGKACARLAAGLLNVGFDDLWRRNQRRTRQRYMLGAGASASAIAASAVGYVMVTGALATSAEAVTAARGETETERTNRLAAEAKMTDAQTQAKEAAALVQQASADRAAAEADLAAARTATAQAKLERLGDKALAAVETIGELSAQEAPFDPDYEGPPPTTGANARTETAEEAAARNLRNQERQAVLDAGTRRALDEAKWRATALVYANVLAGGEGAAPLFERLGFVRTSTVDVTSDVDRVVGDPALERVGLMGYSGGAIVNTRTQERTPLPDTMFSVSPDGRTIALETPEEEEPRLTEPVMPEGYEERLEAAADRVEIPEVDDLADVDIARVAAEYHRVDPTLDLAVLTKYLGDLRDFQEEQDNDASYVDVWSLATGKLEWRASVESYLGDPVFSKDGRTLAVVGDGVMTLWDVATRKQIDVVSFQEYENEKPPEVGFSDERVVVSQLVAPVGATFSRDSSRIHIATNGGDLLTYDVRARRMLRPWHTGYELEFDGLEAGPNHSVALITTRGIGGKADPAFVSYNVDTGRPERIVRPWWCDSNAAPVLTAPATATTPGTLATPARCEIFPEMASSDGRRVAMLSNDVRIFDVLSDAPPVVIPPPKCESAAACLSDATAFGMAANLYAFVAEEDSIHLISTVDGDEERVINAPGGLILSLAFSDDGSRLAAARSGLDSHDEIWTWSVATGELLSRTGPTPDSVASGVFQVQGKGRRMLAGGGYGDPSLQVWESLGPAGETPRAALARVCKARPAGTMMLNDLDLLSLPDTAPKERDLCQWPAATGGGAAS